MSGRFRFISMKGDTFFLQHRADPAENRGTGAGTGGFVRNNVKHGSPFLAQIVIHLLYFITKTGSHGTMKPEENNCNE